MNTRHYWHARRLLNAINWPRLLAWVVFAVVIWCIAIALNH